MNLYPMIPEGINWILENPLALVVHVGAHMPPGFFTWFEILEGMDIFRNDAFQDHPYLKIILDIPHMWNLARLFSEHVEPMRLPPEIVKALFSLNEQFLHDIKANTFFGTSIHNSPVVAMAQDLNYYKGRAPMERLAYENVLEMWKTLDAMAAVENSLREFIEKSYNVIWDPMHMKYNYRDAFYEDYLYINTWTSYWLIGILDETFRRFVNHDVPPWMFWAMSQPAGIPHANHLMRLMYETSYETNFNLSSIKWAWDIMHDKYLPEWKKVKYRRLRMDPDWILRRNFFDFFHRLDILNLYPERYPIEDKLFKKAWRAYLRDLAKGPRPSTLPKELFYQRFYGMEPEETHSFLTRIAEIRARGELYALEARREEELAERLLGEGPSPTKPGDVTAIAGPADTPVKTPSSEKSIDLSHLSPEIQNSWIKEWLESTTFESDSDTSNAVTPRE